MCGDRRKHAAAWRRSAAGVGGSLSTLLPPTDAGWTRAGHRRLAIPRVGSSRYHALGIRSRQRARDRKFADSPLEGNGFELVVPRHESRGFPEHPQVPGLDRVTLRDRKFADSSLERTGFEPSVPLLRKISRLLPKADAGPIKGRPARTAPKMKLRPCL